MESRQALEELKVQSRALENIKETLCQILVLLEHVTQKDVTGPHYEGPRYQVVDFK